MAPLKERTGGYVNMSQKRRSFLICLVLVLVLLLPFASCAPQQPAAVEPTPTSLTTSSVDVLGEEAYHYVSQLTEAGSRVTGSSGEGQTVTWLQEQFSHMGLAVKVQDFPVTLFLQEKPGVTVLSPAEQALKAIPLRLSASGEVSGEVIDVGLGRKEDIPQQGLGGQIALVERGGLTFSQKVANVGDAGAAAVIIYNNIPGLFAGTLLTATAIPAVSISREDGLRLKELLLRGKVEAKVWVKWQEHTSHNVIATIAGHSTKLVVLGAHHDAVIGSPGANDNASGTAVLLTVARQLAGKLPAGEVRFVAFGAEEEGLLGSSYYVQSLSAEERSRILAMINLDVVGADIPLAVNGESKLSETVRSVARRLNIEVTGDAGNAASDHLSFLRFRIPAVLLSTPDFSRIHSPRDNLEAINSRRLGEASLLVITLVNYLLEETAEINTRTSFQGIDIFLLNPTNVTQVFSPLHPPSTSVLTWLKSSR